MAKTGNKKLSGKEQQTLLATLKERFDKNNKRHHGILWKDVEARLEGNPAKLWSLHEMEKTGGEPDVVEEDKKTGEYLFYDCAAESPKERRSFCYDEQALAARKKNKPKDSAVKMATEMGIELLTQEQYLILQQSGNYDTKTSSWIATPEEVRKLGGALFADFRFGRTFVYHNGAESYYAGRGFRGVLRL